MKTRLRALCLALVLIFTMATGGLAAGDNSCKLSITAGYQDGQIMAMVTMEESEGVTNGRLAVTYDSETVELFRRPGLAFLWRIQRESGRGRYGISGLGRQ